MSELNNPYFLAKFGKKEDIEKLNNGEIFFNNIQAYRDDGTAYRGDKMEGKIPLDPHKIEIYDKDGNDIFDKIPYPDTLIQSFVGDEKLKMFCAAIIDSNVMYHLKDDEWLFKEEFKNAIKGFGEYVLLFWEPEIINNIQNAQKIHRPKIIFEARKIIYRDLTDYEHTEAYRLTGSAWDIYFIKGLGYQMQNEWRIIIDGEDGEIKENCGNGFLLSTSPFKFGKIMKTSEFLNATLTIKE